MIPIFSSLNMMQRALEVAQEAIQTTGHNVSNANTDGYSRQRVNLSAATPYPAVGINADRGAGQVGTGVSADSVVRIRDQFVDLQVRDNTNQNGYWSAVSDAYSQMEDIINEPTDTGISAVLDNFWQSLQDLAGNSGTSGTGTVVLQNGAEVADTFNYLSLSLGKVQDNLNQQITENIGLVNNYSDQINELNKEINAQEANGLLANDLYDQRDALTEKLAQLVPIQVSATRSGGNPSALAEGLYTIEIVDKNGTVFSPAATLVDGTGLTNNHLQRTPPDNPDVALSMTASDDKTPAGPASLSNLSGKLQGLIDAYSVDFPEVTDSLNHMADTLAKNFNQVYAQNAGYTGTKGTFFIGDSVDPAHSGTVTAANIHVNGNLTGGDVLSNEKGSPSGDNTGAQNMADVIAVNTYAVDGPTSTPVTLKNDLQGLIGQIGVNAQSAQQFTDNSNALLQAAKNRQSSVSGVSMDEELTNLIQYQHTYESAARVVTTLDSLLDTLINKMS